MKAIILKDFGGPENLVSTEIPVPDISENEVLVQVKAISVNPVDYKTRVGKNRLASSLREFSPIILGWDISGIVKRTGENVKLFKDGDEVFGMVNFPGHGKAYAEYVAAPEAHLTMKPSNISHAEAAAATLAALTAWQIFKERIILKPGDKILIHAAAGGVGHYAVQMAKYLGAEITATASAENRDFVLGLGAVRHVNYQNEKFEDVIHDMDWVFDGIGGDYTDRSLKVLKPGGTIVTLPSGTSPQVSEKARAMGLNGYSFFVKSDGNDMKEIAGFLEKGIIKSHISGTFKLDEIRSAHRQIETGKTRGKIVVLMD